MWTHVEPYFYFYLAGCLCAVFVLPAKAIIIYFIYWIAKDNILNKNVKKINPPNKRRTFGEWMIYLGVVAFEIVLLSWITVIINLCHLVVTLFGVLRQIFTSVPEEIKSLRFPLKNNPHMLRESVWAHVTALSVKHGEPVPNYSTLVVNLNQVSGYYQSFDRISALKQLDDLHIISSEIISNALKQLQPPD